jgi:hypothetical protein
MLIRVSEAAAIISIMKNASEGEVVDDAALYVGFFQGRSKESFRLAGNHNNDTMPRIDVKSRGVGNMIEQTASGQSTTSWFKRHSRIATFVGTFIVFATFVVKDIFQERAKDLNDALASAQSSYTLLGRFDQEDVTLRNLGIAFTLIEEKVMPATVPKVSFKGVSPILQAATNLSEFQRARIENLRTLLEKFPIGTRNQAVLEIITREMNDYDRRRANVESMEERYEGRSAIKDLSELKANIGEGVADLSQAERHLDYGVSSFCKTILEAAHNEQLKREKAYRNWIHFSYGLYCLGWTLGLLGKIYGVDATSGGE